MIHVLTLTGSCRITHAKTNLRSCHQILSAETQYLRISTLLRRLILTSNASSLESPQITHFCYRKIPKISPGAYIFKRRFLRASFWRGLSTERNLRFKIDLASLISGRNLLFLLCFTLYLRAISIYIYIFGGAI